MSRSQSTPKRRGPMFRDFLPNAGFWWRSKLHALPNTSHDFQVMHALKAQNQFLPKPVKELLTALFDEATEEMIAEIDSGVPVSIFAPINFMRKLRRKSAIAFIQANAPSSFSITVFVHLFKSCLDARLTWRRTPVGRRNEIPKNQELPELADAIDKFWLVAAPRWREDTGDLATACALQVKILKKYGIQALRNAKMVTADDFCTPDSEEREYWEHWAPIFNQAAKEVLHQQDMKALEETIAVLGLDEAFTTEMEDLVQNAQGLKLEEGTGGDAMEIDS